MRIIHALILASVLAYATGVVARAQQPQRADPMTQRLATCVDVLSGVASGQLVDRVALAQSFKAAFEQANPGQTLDASMKAIPKPTEKPK